MANDKLVRLLDETIQSEDPFLGAQDIRLKDEVLLEKFKNLYDAESRHNYNQITAFVLEKYKKQGENQEECLALARRIERLINLADSKCLKQCSRLRCEKVEPPNFVCLEEKGACFEYKR